jgi:hypothetical protein
VLANLLPVIVVVVVAVVVVVVVVVVKHCYPMRIAPSNVGVLVQHHCCLENCLHLTLYV